MAVREFGYNNGKAVEWIWNDIAESCISDSETSIGQLYGDFDKGHVNHSDREPQIHIEGKHIASVEAGLSSRSVQISRRKTNDNVIAVCGTEFNDRVMEFDNRWHPVALLCPFSQPDYGTAMSLVPWHMVLGWLKLSVVVRFLIGTRGPTAAIVVTEDIEEQGLTTRQHRQEDETSDEG